MITKLGWEPLENRRAVSRLSLLYKSIHHMHGSHKHGWTSNFPSWQQNPHPEVMCNLLYPPHCQKGLLQALIPIPRTMTEWNVLPPDIRQTTSVDSLKSKLNNMDLTSFIRGPTTKVYSTCHKRACNSNIPSAEFACSTQQIQIQIIDDVPAKDCCWGFTNNGQWSHDVPCNSSL